LTKDFRLLIDSLVHWLFAVLDCPVGIPLEQSTHLPANYSTGKTPHSNGFLATGVYSTKVNSFS